MKSKKLIKKVKTPPKDWPSSEDWEGIEDDLKTSIPSNVLSKNASPVDRTKNDLCQHFVIYLKSKGLTQRELAAELGISESRVSEIVHYHFERYTIDKLMELLSIIKPTIKIEVA